jgi:hypothetical protein
VPGALAPSVAQAAVRLGAWMPFEAAAGALEALLKVRASDSTVRRHAEAAGAAYVGVQAAEVARLERGRPEPPAGPAVLQVSADGAMVPLVRGEWAEVKTLAVGEVGTRTTREGARVAQTAGLTYFSRLTDSDTFGRLALSETHRRGVEAAGVVVGVMDGAEWLQGFLDYHRPDAVRVLDFPHAMEHLAAAARASLADAATCAAWLAERAADLKERSPELALAALRALPADGAADPAAAAEARDATLAYLEKRAGQVRYAEFLAAGYPIGSGCVESAHKTVVEARMKGGGMRWGRANVDPMLALRNIAANDRWDEAWPEITAELRRQACRRADGRRALRRAARPVAAPAPQAPPADPVPPPTPVAPAPPVPRPKLVVDGRPTKDHPWKRYRACATPRPRPDRSPTAQS